MRRSRAVSAPPLQILLNGSSSAIRVSWNLRGEERGSGGGSKEEAAPTPLHMHCPTLQSPTLHPPPSHPPSLSSPITPSHLLTVAGPASLKASHLSQTVECTSL